MKDANKCSKADEAMTNRIESSADEVLAQRYSSAPESDVGRNAGWELIVRHLDRLREFAEKRGLTEGDAYDVAIEANEKALQKLRERKFEPGGPGSYSSWLTKLTHNMIRDRHLSAKKTEPLDVDDGDGMSSHRISQLGLVTSDTPEARALQVAAREHVEVLLDSVGLTSEEMLVMQYTVDGLKPRDIEELTGISSAQVSRLLYRARKKITTMFPEDDPVWH